MALNRLVLALGLASVVACSESFLAGSDESSAAVEPAGDGVIMRFGAVARVDSLYPVAVAFPGQPAVPHRVPAFNGYFLCATSNGFSRREVETVTHNGEKYLRVFPVGCVAIHEDSVRT